LQVALLPEALDALVVDDLAVRPKQRMNTRRSEAWMLLLDLLYLLLQRLVVTRMRSVAGAGTRDFHEAAGFALGKATCCGLGNHRSCFRERVGGLGYFLRLYWGL
jgi:hypothetical protein